MDGDGAIGFDGEGPAFVDEGVVPRAGADRVVGGGRSALMVRDDVVDVAARGGDVASGPSTPAVAGFDGSSEGWIGEAGLGAVRKELSGGIEMGVGDGRVTEEPIDDGGREAGPIGTDGPDAGGELEL